MGRVTRVMRARLEMQGFLGLSDERIAEVHYWLRLSPLICGFWTLVGTWLGSAAVLLTLVPFAALGGILPNHPFDTIYTHGFRRWFGGARLPRYGAPRRFACLLASGWLVAAAACFQWGAPTAGRVLGSVLVALATVQVTTGFCVPSWLFNTLRGADPAQLAHRHHGQAAPWC